jgi:hypothetical protein
VAGKSEQNKGAKDEGWSAEPGSPPNQSVAQSSLQFLNIPRGFLLLVVLLQNVRHRSKERWALRVDECQANQAAPVTGAPMEAVDLGQPFDAVNEVTYFRNAIDSHTPARHFDGCDTECLTPDSCCVFVLHDKCSQRWPR